MMCRRVGRAVHRGYRGMHLHRRVHGYRLLQSFFQHDRAYHAVAAACLTAGIDGGEINRVLFEIKSMPRFQMERIVFDTMEFFEDGAVAVALLWRTDIDRTGADMDDPDSIASLTRQIEGADRHYTD